jgi:hypothetical protein
VDRCGVGELADGRGQVLADKGESGEGSDVGGDVVAGVQQVVNG